MKKLLPQIAFLFLLLLPLLGRAQEVQISGRVVDAKTKSPIPSTSISLRNSGIGTLTDEFGRFRLAGLKSFQQDSIVVINLAYERYYGVVKIDSSKELLIELLRGKIVPSVPGVVTFTCNLSSHNPERNIEAELLAAIPGRQYAFLILNEAKKQFGKIQTVSFYIGETGLPMKSFHIRVYKADGNYYSPKTDLLNGLVFVMATKANQWYTVDLSRYNIAVPEDGYFVALEFGNATNALSQPLLENYVPSGVIMQPAAKFSKSIMWSRSSENGWSLCPKSRGLYRFNSMLKVEVGAVQ